MTAAFDETLTAYVPELLAHRATGARPEAWGERLAGAVLFADVVGFTALAERHAERGAAGVEALSKVLSSYFGRMVELIAEHGGQVIRFAGDAPIALWLADESGLAGAVLAATQCGLALQSRLTSPGASDDGFALRVGVGAGDVVAISAGGVEGRWEFLVAGDPLQQMAAAERAAKPGEVVVSPAAARWLGARIVGHTLPDGSVRVGALSGSFNATRAARLPGAAHEAAAPRALEAGVVRAYVPRTVLARLDAGQEQWLAELRRVSVLFLNLMGVDFAAPDAPARTQAAVCAMQQVVYELGGSVNQLVVDDKGTTLVAAWGLPSRTYEDDAVRAALAAGTLARALGAQGLRAGIGVATGRVFCGERGNSRRREYAMIGSVVNSAARLMIAAGDGVLCDEATQRAAAPRVRFDALSPVRMKGRSEPVAVFRPRADDRAAEPAAGARPAAAAPMVGRVRECDALVRQVEALRAGMAGRVAIVEGEPGIGKSVLLEAVVAHAARAGVRCARGAADAVARATPYFGFRAVLEDVLELTPGMDLAQRRARVLARLAAYSELVPWAPLLEEVLPLGLADNDVTRQMTGQIRGDSTRELLVGLLRDAARERPMLLALDDAHWLDSVSWAVLLAAHRQVPALMVLLATRPMGEQAPAEFRELCDAPGAARVALTAMSPDESVALVAAKLGVDSLPAALATQIRERAEGHPYFAEELARSLIDAGLLRVEGGHCRLAPEAGDLRGITLPDSVQAAITSRVDRLTPQQQLTLKVASIFGRVFALRPLSDVHPVAADRLTLPAQLAALQRSDVAVSEAVLPEAVYAFKHLIVQEVAYGLMLFSQRQKLHRAVAEWYEQHVAEDRSGSAALLAHHWLAAGDDARSFDALERAGGEALAQGANREAAHFFAQALALWETRGAATAHLVPPLRRARWCRALGEAYYGLGELTRSREYFDAALVILGSPLPSDARAWALRLSREVASQAARLFVPAARRRDASAGLDAHERWHEAAAIAGMVGEQRYYATDLLGWLTASLASINLAERSGQPATAGRAYGGLGYLAGVARLPKLAHRWFERSRDGTDPRSRANGFYSEGLYHLGTGEWPAVRARVAEGLELARTVGDHYSIGIGLTVLGVAEQLSGRYAAADAAMRSLLAGARTRLNVQHEVWAQLQLTSIDMERGRTTEARAWLRDAEPLIERADPLSAQIYECLRASGAHAVRERDETRRRVAAALAVIGKNPPMVFSFLPPYALLADASLWLLETAGVRGPAEVAEALGHARAVLDALGKFALAFPIGRPRAKRLRAGIERLRGRTAAARKGLSEVVVLAQKWSIPREGALAKRELAALPDVPASERARLEGEARRELQALGCE